MKVVIPSRFASTRLPGKPLADIHGKPMIWHVWQRGVKAVGASDCWVATDHLDIFNVMQDFGAQVVMTREDHVSGTDRIAEVATKLGWSDDDIVVNVQGDEPLIPAELVAQTGQLLLDMPVAGMSTLACPIVSAADVDNPNVVKVVCAKDGLAHYFSRAPIPYNRDGRVGHTYLRHLGIYGYRVKTLKALTELAPAPTEQLESLEQLRALWHGIQIAVATIDEAPPHGVDTPEDLAAVRKALET